MRYPTLPVRRTDRQMVDVFGGYNHNLMTQDGEFYDMKNMTSDHYPILSPRKKRGVYASPTSPTGMIAKDSLCYVDGTNFIMNEYSVDMGLNNEPKTMVSMGAYVVILPDKKYINTADLTDFGSIEASVQTEAPVTFTLCRNDGEDYSVNYIQATAPAEPNNMDVWCDTSCTPNALKQWSDTSGMWVSITTTYIKISSTGIGVPFEKFDGVKISGLSNNALTDNASGELIEDTSELSVLDGATVIWGKGDDYIVVVGILSNTVTISNEVTITRAMPDMDFVVESENRLWGCRYGTNEDGNAVNEIYASKLGDFKNWGCFMGLSTDSYSASLGTDGQFTGAVTHLGYPLFFKENCVHKVFGNYPANYQIQTTACRGVQKDCEKSLAIVNEVLYYKTRTGVCAYDGSLPVEISAAFGDKHYSNAVAVSHGNKYYISMQGTDSVDHSLFVYDAQKGLWHKEDDLYADSFCSCREELYCIEHNTKQIITMLGSGIVDSANVPWMVETGNIGISSPDMKYISRMTVRMSMDIGSSVKFYAQYDMSDEWEELYAVTGTDLRSFSIPIRPRRCDHLKLRIEGEGNAKIYSITNTIEQGSEIS